MSMQQFCLRWNNHQPNFISVFSNLLNNETLVDVTLAAEGRHLQAHKVVLSACSTYFQSLFTVNPCQHPIVILKDVKFSDLKIMVDFMYYGEVNVSQDQLPSIIKTAESLKIKGLAEMHTASLTKWPSGSTEPGGGDRGESCSPSPSPLSPSFRRKRLRKSSTGSTSGSGDKPEEMNEITLVATNIVKPEPLIVSQETGENLRRPVNTSTESQGSIDEDQISIMSNMENSSTATPAQSDGSIQDVSQQSGSNIGQSSVSSEPPSHQGSNEVGDNKDSIRYRHQLHKHQGRTVSNRKRCRICYESIQKLEGAPDARRKSRRVTTFCNGCEDPNKWQDETYGRNMPNADDARDLKTTRYHEIKRKEGQVRRVRRSCKGCYDKNVKQFGSQFARKSTKKVATFCDDCPGKPHLCLPCYNARHRISCNVTSN